MATGPRSPAGRRPLRRGPATHGRGPERRVPPAAAGPGTDLVGDQHGAALHAPRRGPVRHGRVGGPRGDHHQRARRDGVRAEGPRVPQGVVPARHPGDRQQVLPRHAGHPGARDERQADDRPGGRHDRRLGPDGRLLRDRCGRGHLPGRADRHPPQAARRLQQPRLVQRGHRRPPPVLSLLHQLGGRHHGQHPDPGPHRGHALQVRLAARAATSPRCARSAKGSAAAAVPPARSAS